MYNKLSKLSINGITRSKDETGVEKIFTQIVCTMHSFVERRQSLLPLLLKLAVTLVAIFPTITPAEEPNPLEKFKTIPWVIPSYYDTPACRMFMEDLVHHQDKIKVIPPLVETTDWGDEKLQKYIKGCAKEDFTVNEIQNMVKTDNNRVVPMPSGRIYYSIDRFAVWGLELEYSPKKGRDILLYTGPQYRLLPGGQSGGKGKEFVYGGGLIEIIQPGCRKVLKNNEGAAFPDAEVRPRESQVITYQGKTIMLMVKNGARDKYLYRLSTIELLGNGKSKKLCSIYQKDIN